MKYLLSMLTIRLVIIISVIDISKLVLGNEIKSSVIVKLIGKNQIIIYLFIIVHLVSAFKWWVRPSKGV